jgi:hypothetical protein
VIVLALAVSQTIKQAASIVVTVLEVQLNVELLCWVRGLKSSDMERVLVEPLGEVGRLSEIEQE